MSKIKWIILILTLSFLSCKTFPSASDEKYTVGDLPEFVSTPDTIALYKSQLNLYQIIYSDRKLMEASGKFNIDPEDFLYIESIVKYLEENLKDE